MRRKRQKFTIPSKYLLLIMTCVCVLFMAVTFFTDFWRLRSAILRVV